MYLNFWCHWALQNQLWCSGGHSYTHQFVLCVAALCDVYCLFAVCIFPWHWNPVIWIIIYYTITVSTLIPYPFFLSPNPTESKFGQFCRFDVQCQSFDSNTRCNTDLNVCECQPRFRPNNSKNSGGRKDTKCIGKIFYHFLNQILPIFYCFYQRRLPPPTAVPTPITIRPFSG